MRVKLELVFKLESYQEKEVGDVSKDIQSFLDRLKLYADDLGYKVVKGEIKKVAKAESK